ncbi:hypothetical protein LXL04_024583 [Taraxacum kok-saghyz]
MLVYTTQSGSDKRINLMWEHVRVPKQPGNTECGYYVCKFMKEIIDNRLNVLVNANIGDGKQVYKDVDLDGIHEDWAHYVSNFFDIRNLRLGCFKNYVKLDLSGFLPSGFSEIYPETTNSYEYSDSLVWVGIARLQLPMYKILSNGGPTKN